MEKRKEKADLEKRVEELERLVREIIQWKEDRIIIQLDKNWREIWEAIHNYHIDEAQYERQFENGVAKYDLKVDKNWKVVSGWEFRELC